MLKQIPDEDKINLVVEKLVKLTKFKDSFLKNSALTSIRYFLEGNPKFFIADKPHSANHMSYWFWNGYESATQDTQFKTVLEKRSASYAYWKAGKVVRQYEEKNGKFY